MIIGSLTTITGRINNLYKVIESLYSQTHKLDHIYLFISKEKHLIDEGIKDIPANLNQYINNKFLIIEYVENHGPYRKFIPIIKKFIDKDDIRIVFFDDDWIYPEMLIEKMVETHDRFPDCLITLSAHKIHYDKNGNLKIRVKNNKSYFKDKTFYEPN